MAEDLALFSSLFQGAFPEEWKRDPEFVKYLSELTSFSINRLTREPDLIKEEQECVLNSTQNLAFNNYKTFIQTAECSREVFREFIAVEGHVNKLIDKLPNFSTSCKQFGKDAQDISSKRKLNSLALSRHTQLLEILEIPQLMETCVRNGYYEEALELSAHVRRMEKKHNNILIIKNIAADIERCSNLMLTELIQQLQGNIQLPSCLRLVGLLRRMEVFTEVQLRLKFLQSRDYWLQSVLSSIPKDDPYMHISKTIESCRVHLFDIVTQYKAIFPDDDSMLIGIHGNTGKQADGTLFCGWLNNKIWQFLQLLESDLRKGVSGRVDSLLSQCMYFGLSFSRVGADFRVLIAPVFIRVALQSFQQSVRNAKHSFHEAMKHFTLSQPLPSLSSSSSPLSSFSPLSPPHSLLPYHPLLLLTNSLISAFNDLRSCAPVALAPEISREVERLLQSTVHDIGEYYRLENGSFTQNEFKAFEELCKVIAFDLLPYIERCLATLYPEDNVQRIAMRSSLSLRRGGGEGEGEGTGKSLSSSSRRQTVVKVGISAKVLAEPLRDLVPEVFEEYEREEVAKSVARLVSDSTAPVVDLTTLTIESTSPTADLTVPNDDSPPNDSPVLPAEDSSLKETSDTDEVSE